MVNRFYKRTPYDIGLYTPPVEAIQQTLQIAQQRYDTNYALAESIKNNFIPSLPQDRAEANRIQNEWNTRIDEIVSSYGGDYSQAGKQLNSLLSDIRKQYNPGGKANAITGNFNNYNTWLAREQEKIQKGNILAEDLNLANRYYMKQYKGVGDLDPVTGTYNAFNPEALADYKDYNKLISDINKDIPEEFKRLGTTKVNQNGYDYYTEEEVKGKNPTKLYNAFLTGLVGDPGYSTYLQQRSRFMGVDSNTTNQLVMSLAKQKAEELGGYYSVSSIEKAKANPFAVAKYKAGLDKQNMQEMMGSLLQYNQSVPSNYTLEPDIDHTDWKGSTLKNYLPGIGDVNASLSLAGGNPIVGLLAAPLVSGVRAANSKIAKDNVTLDTFLNDSKNDARLTSRNVIPNLARAMWDRQKSYLGQEFKQKYGKDEAYTNKVDQDFWYNYKQEAKNQTAYQAYSFAIPGPAKKSALRLIPDVEAGNAAVYIPGRPGQTTKVDNDILKSLRKDGKIQYDNISVNYVVPGPGYEAAGFEVVTPKGSFVIVDPDYQRSQYSRMLATGLNPIFQQGKDRGLGAIPYEYTGVDQQGQMNFNAGVPHVKWEYNSATGSWDQNIYMHEQDGSPIKRKDGSQVRVTMPQIMDTNLGLFSRSLGYGQTKSAGTPFGYFQSQYLNR